MQVVIKAKNTEMTAQERTLIEEKTTKLDRYLDSISQATVEVRHEHTRNAAESYVVQMTLHANGHLLRAEERAADTRTAVDAVIGIIQRQLTRYKERLYGRGRNHVAKDTTLRMALATEPAAESADGSQRSEPRIVRTKQFPIKPMTPEEAAQQMEMLGHDFFIFQNDTNQQFNVLYRRRDGNYGLIEPEVA